MVETKVRKLQMGRSHTVGIHFSQQMRVALVDSVVIVRGCGCKRISKISRQRRRRKRKEKQARGIKAQLASDAS